MMDNKVVKRNFKGELVTVRESLDSSDKKIATINDAIRELEAKVRILQREQNDTAKDHLINGVLDYLEGETNRVIRNDAGLHSKVVGLVESVLSHGTRVAQTRGVLSKEKICAELQEILHE